MPLPNLLNQATTTKYSSTPRKTLRVAINGFGRIGRNVLRVLLERHAQSLLQTGLHSSSVVTTATNDMTIEIVAINDVSDHTSLVHLLNYDSTHGRLSHIGFQAQLQVQQPANKLLLTTIDTRPWQSIALYAEQNPQDLPWQELDVDVVLEATGMFRSYQGAHTHITAGAKQVIIGAAPFDYVDACIVMGVNDEQLTCDLPVISSVSCTTQALVPLIHALNEQFGVESAMMTEIHAVTADQNVLDQGHRDLRRSRAAGYNIIPTTSSSIGATERVLPHMIGRINGHSIRVPTIDVAAIDVTFIFRESPTVEQLRDCLRHASDTTMYGIMGYTDEPLVSSDFVHQSESLIIDEKQLMQIGKQYKVFAWYDNEWGYANRLLDMCQLLCAKK